jgi:hypothetical protein
LCPAGTSAKLSRVRTEEEKSGMKSVEVAGEIPVGVPLEQAWKILSDLPGWSAWNPFVTAVHGATRPVVGARVRLDVRWQGGSRAPRTAVEVVEVIDDATRRGFRWDLRGPLHRLGLLRSSRLIAVERVGPDACRYRSEERFTGPLVRLLPVARLRDGFDRMAAAFAAECAARH